MQISTDPKHTDASKTLLLFCCVLLERGLRGIGKGENSGGGGFGGLFDFKQREREAGFLVEVSRDFVSDGRVVLGKFGPVNRAFDMMCGVIT